LALSRATRSRKIAGSRLSGSRRGAAAELWKSDGTVAGTVRVKDILAGPGNSVPSGLAVFDGNVYFGANDGTQGVELAAGSDPLDASSVPSVSGVPALPPWGSALLASVLFASGIARLRHRSRSR
jgi:ELWxxDGT repeat protein